MKTVFTGVVCLVMMVFLMGCPTPPPFDTSGTYEGTWQGQAGPEGEIEAEAEGEGEGEGEGGAEKSEVQEIAACPLRMTLTQDTSLNYPGDHGVKGTVLIDYSCIELPEWANQDPVPSYVKVSGILGDYGTLTLLSGGCGPGICVVLALSGAGEDTDGDLFMDTYAGDWSYTILLAGVRPFGVRGTFAVAWVDGPPLVAPEGEGEAEGEGEGAGEGVGG